MIEDCIEFTDRFLSSWPEATWDDVRNAVRLRFEYITDVRITVGNNLIRIWIRTNNPELGRERYIFEVDHAKNHLRNF